MGSLGSPKDYGRRLLAHVIEDAAKENPTRVVYAFPVTNDISQGFHHITNKRYANGINRTSWYLESKLGKPATKVFPTVGYIGPSDLRYAMLAVAAARVGYKMMFLSPRNSLEGHLAVIDRSDCHLWLLPSQRLGRVEQVLEKRELAVHPMPELLDLLDERSVDTYPYGKTFTEARNDPFVVLHTSGSTGLPKPVIVPNGSLATPDAHHLLPPVEGRLTQTQFFTTPHKAYSTFPNFHSAGMVFNFALPFFYEVSIVLGPPMVPVNLELIHSILDHTDVDVTLLAPSTLEDMSRSPDSLERMAKTKVTFYGGGPLVKECGDIVNKACRVFNIMGVTEGSLFPVVQAEPDDWNYHQFHPDGGYTFHQRTDELYELFQTRDPKLNLTQAFFQTFPDMHEYATKDLYSKHPTKAGRWLYRGRTDDVIVLSNGEKVNPLDMEACIQGHPIVKACVIVGQGRFQTTALVQLQQPRPTTEHELQALKDELWPSMEAANREAPAHAQLHKDYIIFAADDKPFPLAGKETVLRAMTGKLYEGEIEDFYSQREQQEAQMSSIIIDVSSVHSIENDLRTLLSQILGTDVLQESDDLFAAGLDSLSVAKVLASFRKTLRSLSGTNDRRISASMVYANPTIKTLAETFEKFVRHGSDSSDTNQQLELMSDLVIKHTANLPEKALLRSAPENAPATVILTGSTGSLGSYLLEYILSNVQVQHIYCLNRSADGRERQIKVNKSRGLSTDLSPERVTFYQSDLSQPYFGLGQTAFEKLLQETTYVVHNQWPVDFNLTLASFEPHIKGIRGLVDFALQSQKAASILFVSSVGVVKNQQSNATIPEALLTDFSSAEAGYGRSKLVSEMVLAEAYQKSGVSCCVCRIGQIAGPVDSKEGMWNKQEWLPSIIASSKHLKMLPESLSSLDRIDWVPVDKTAHIILELGQLGETGRASSDTTMPVFHVVNPSTCSWSSLLPSIQSCLGPFVSTVPWRTWLDALEASEQRGDLEQNPGVKLLDFYRGVGQAGDAGLELPVLETKVSQMKSQTLRSLGPVKGEWMKQWMEQWKF